MSAEAARLLAADPRVKAVRETTAPSAPKPAPSRRIIAKDVLPPITVGPYKYDGAGNIIPRGNRSLLGLPRFRGRVNSWVRRREPTDAFRTARVNRN
jgi:hypothetical protein